MSTPYPFSAMQEAQMHCGGLLKEAERQRLLRQARAAGPGLQGRMLLSASRLLIQCGLRLRRRYQALGWGTDLPIYPTGEENHRALIT